MRTKSEINNWTFDVWYLIFFLNGLRDQRACLVTTAHTNTHNPNDTHLYQPPHTPPPPCTPHLPHRGVYFSRKSELFPSTNCHLPNPSPNSSPTSKLQVPPNQGHRSFFWLFLWWFCAAPQCQMPTWAHSGVSEGGCAPLRSWKILYFWNWSHAIWWILLSTNLEQAMSKKYGPDWPRFCVLGEVLVNILLESLK